MSARDGVAAHDRKSAVARAVAMALCTLAAAPAAAQSAPPPAAPVAAQGWRLEPSIATEVTATNNAGFAARDQAERDVVIDVRPQLAIFSNGARLQVRGEIGADLLHYVNATLTDRVLPRGSLDLKSSLVERLVFLDASLSATSAAADPFAGRAEGASAYNAVASIRTEVSPAIVFAPNPFTRLEARHRSSLVKSYGDLAADDARRHVRREDNLLRFERRPLPIGLTLEATSEDTRYKVQTTAPLALLTARATATWAPNPELVLGLRTGRDRTKYELNDFSEPLHGVTLNWKPDDRTELSGVAEQRFFGKGGELRLDHRSPYLNVFFRLQREPTTSADSLGVIPAGSDLAAALDGILASRIANPAERAREVQNLIVSRGLSPTLNQALEIFSESAQVQQTGTLTLVLLGARHTAALTVFGSRATALARTGQANLAADLRDNRQEGGSLQLSRRLTPLSSVVLLATGTRVVGLGTLSDQASVSKSARLSFDQQLGPRTSTSVGVRRQLLYSTQQPSAQETSVYGTLLHRF